MTQIDIDLFNLPLKSRIINSMFELHLNIHTKKKMFKIGIINA